MMCSWLALRTGAQKFRRRYRNWMRPRHAADFMLFPRLQALTENLQISDNIPYQPKHFLFLQIIKEGDAMILAILTSGMKLGVQYIMDLPNPVRVEVRKEAEIVTSMGTG